MTKKEEAAYLRGQRSMWVKLIHEACRQIGYADIIVQQTQWILERETIIAVLRQVCAEHGDNDWTEDLHLGDIIEKHLYKYLEKK